MQREYITAGPRSKIYLSSNAFLWIECAKLEAKIYWIHQKYGFRLFKHR
jgi:hypothetical protein